MGLFITFEGVEGCGKTTQIRLLADALERSGKSVKLTREPGGCPIADKIRGILLDAANSEMTPTAELLLYAAARAQHIKEVITPAMKAGNIVLCDRFTDATLAYQGFGRGLDIDLIKKLNETATGGCRPELTILIDCPVEIGLGRAVARIEAGSAADKNHLREERFERESLEFHQRVRNGYLKLAADAPERFVIIDGAGSVDEISTRIFEAVLPRIN
ncbi:MAG: dTMP kinase [Geobacteraceae bacterium]|nr:dTMP kinase [Geobacteraceae bacterium]